MDIFQMNLNVVFAKEKKEEGNKEETKEEKKEQEKKDESKEESPQEIVLKVDMHCEACARKVAKALKGFQGHFSSLFTLAFIYSVS